MTWLASVRTFSILFSIALLASCQSRQENDNQDIILGKWEIRQAYRNGRLTESLDELYFEFFQDGKMNTNILGMPESSIYAIKGNQLQQREGQLDIDYTIEELSDSLLVLSTELRGYNFRLSLKRTIRED